MISYKTIALFSHNPAITEFANQLTTVKVDDHANLRGFCGKGRCEKVERIFYSPKKDFWFFDYPKKD